MCPLTQLHPHHGVHSARGEVVEEWGGGGPDSCIPANRYEEVVD